MFRNINVNISEHYPDNYNNKRQKLLTDIGGKCYINNIEDKHPSMNKPRSSKEAQKKEDDIKVRLQK